MDAIYVVQTNDYERFVCRHHIHIALAHTRTATVSHLYPQNQRGCEECNILGDPNEQSASGPDRAT